MSGGVDSSVAAAILKKKGFEVVGVFMKLWAEEEKGEAEERAKKVAKILGIPFYILDLKKEFKKRIVDCFLEDCKKGITPNPCVVCNKEIKFGLLVEKALAMGADFVATGHYAKKIKPFGRLPADKIVTDRNSKCKIFKLLKAKDKKKDQSYFLWRLNQNQLERILFPLGDYTRQEVKDLAKEFRLPVLKAKKSVEICFIRWGINNFLKKYLGEKEGQIVDEKGKVIGKHKGLWFYTIGQREGIGLGGGPYFVLSKDVGKNILVATKDERLLFKKELICKSVNWISGKPPKMPAKIEAQIRYRAKPAEANVFFEGRKLKVEFLNPQRAITPGQSAVFYKGEEVLGGGVISA